MILYIPNGRDSLCSARVPENYSGSVSRLSLSSEDGQVVVSPRLYEVSSTQRMMQEFLKYPFVYLDTLREGSKENHPVMAGTLIDLVRFDDVDLVSHPFLDQETVVVNGLVSDGSWLSPAHTEMMGQRATP